MFEILFWCIYLVPILIIWAIFIYTWLDPYSSFMWTRLETFLISILTLCPIFNLIMAIALILEHFTPIPEPPNEQFEEKKDCGLKTK